MVLSNVFLLFFLNNQCKHSVENYIIGSSCIWKDINYMGLNFSFLFNKTSVLPYYMRTYLCFSYYIHYSDVRNKAYMRPEPLP